MNVYLSANNVYHTPAYPNATRARCGLNLVRSFPVKVAEAVAIAAGGRPCKRCFPERQDKVKYE